MTNTESKWIVAMTGASGMRYGLRLIEVLTAHASEVHVVISDAGHRVLAEEEGIKLSPSRLSTEALLGASYSNVVFHNPRDIGAPIASGSFRFDGMAVVPSSMSTLASMASGVTTNLIHRAADVTMKEGRRLVVVPRETPLSTIHLENMARLSREGVRMVAAMPGFYHQPKSINDLVDMLVMKILDAMGIDNDLCKRWGETLVPESGLELVR